MEYLFVGFLERFKNTFKMLPTQTTKNRSLRRQNGKQITK